MPIDITMPALSPTMETGALAKWLVKVGDAVKSGDILAEIETDKATMEVESIDEGTVAELLVAAGDDAIPVGQVIARLSVEGEDSAPAPSDPRDGEGDRPAVGGQPGEGSPSAATDEGPTRIDRPSTMPEHGPPSRTGEDRGIAVPQGTKLDEVNPEMAERAASEPSLPPSPSDKSAPATAGMVDPSETERVNASPLARRLAQARGIDLAVLTGSGPNGRIVKADLDGAPAASAAPNAAAEAAVPTAATPPVTTDAAPPAPAAAPPVSTPTAPTAAADPTEAAPAAPASAADPTAAPPSATVPAAALTKALAYPPPEGVPVEAVKLSNMRKVIARRLTESKATVPHFYLTVDVRLDALLALRADLNRSLDKSGVKLSVNDLLIKALGLALVAVPDANVQFAGDTLYKFGRADVSVAVAIPGGLITPIVVDAANKRPSVIATEMKDLAARAKDGKLKPEEYTGGTASISNLGMFGIKQFDAVINPPQGLIVAVGAGEKRPYVVDDALAVATVMSATGSFDHRAIDGATGAAFMAALKGLIEAPLAMLA